MDFLKKYGVWIAGVLLLGGIAVVVSLRRPPAPPDFSGKRYVRKDDTHVVFAPSEKKAVASNPSALYRQYRLTPMGPDPKNGKIDSMEVSYLAPDCLLGAAGLRERDRIVEINGEPVDKVEKMLNLAQKITDGKPLSLVVVRDGRKFPCVLEFQ